MDLNSSPPVPEESFEIDISNSISRHQVREERTRRSFKRDHASIERKRLPPGWLNCPEFGREIHSIIPSKVPLDESFNDSIPPDKRYTSMQLPIHHPRIGLVIDLSNSLRYYTPSDLLKAGIEYVKIPCKGIDSVPDDMSVDKFVNDVIQFFSDCEKQGNTKKFNMVLVHCTHGHNRTGFMIVHFLVRVHSFSVTRALKRFSDARPPGIYKPDYIDALYAFYNEAKPEAVVCPPTPEWKRFKAVQDDDGDVGSIAPVHENVNDDVVLVMTNDDILGDEIPDVQQRSLKQFCCRMLDSKGTNCWQFPGSHPVSLDRDNLQRLRQRYYYATWKADGTRYLMLITTDGCYLIDRRFNFRRVEMRFPCRIGLVENTTHNYTLLDGEMVIDTVPDSQKLKQERRYLIYDMIAFNNVWIIDRPFYERFKMVEKEVIEPRNHERKNRIPHDYRYETEAFRVRRKDFWVLSTVTKLLKEFIPRLSHDADGLIFQGWDDPYVPKTHEGLLKWKYPEMNSVDFLFELGEDDDPNLLVFERGKRKIMKGDRVKFKDGMDESIYSGKIIECGWDCDEKVWVFMRIRTDKTTPNDIKTYRKVRRSIEDNITEEDLLKEIYNIIRLPMYADRIKFDTTTRPRFMKINS